MAQRQIKQTPGFDGKCLFRGLHLRLPGPSTCKVGTALFRRKLARATQSLSQPNIAFKTCQDLSRRLLGAGLPLLVVTGRSFSCRHNHKKMYPTVVGLASHAQAEPLTFFICDPAPHLCSGWANLPRNTTLLSLSTANIHRTKLNQVR